MDFKRTKKNSKLQEKRVTMTVDLMLRKTSTTVGTRLLSCRSTTFVIWREKRMRRVQQLAWER